MRCVERRRYASNERQHCLQEAAAAKIRIGDAAVAMIL